MPVSLVTYLEWDQIYTGCKMKKCFEQPDKFRYNSEKDAETMMLIIGPDSKKLKAYHCDSCDGWHLAKKKK